MDTLGFLWDILFDNKNITERSSKCVHMNITT